MADLLEELALWRKREERLNERIAEFERSYRHRKPCDRYRETGYCPHVASAQERKFGKDTASLMNDLLVLRGKRDATT